MDGWTNDWMNVQTFIVVRTSLSYWFVSPVEPNIYPYLPKSGRKTKTNHIFQWTVMRHESDLKRVWNVFNINTAPDETTSQFSSHQQTSSQSMYSIYRTGPVSQRTAPGRGWDQYLQERWGEAGTLPTENRLISKRAKKIKVFKWFQSSSAEFQFKNKPALMLVWLLAFWARLWLDTKTCSCPSEAGLAHKAENTEMFPNRSVRKTDPAFPGL